MHILIYPYIIIGQDDINKIKSALPFFLKFILTLIEKGLEMLQISVTGSLPLIHTKELNLCSNKCSNQNPIVIINSYGIGALNFNFKAPFINKNLPIPSNGLPIKMFDPFNICLPIPLLTWYIFFN